MKSINNKYINFGTLLIELLLYYLLFVVKQVISFDIISHLIMLGLLFLNHFYLFNKSFNKIKFKKYELILLILVNIIISFCVSAKVLFMYDYVMTTGIKPLTWFLMVNIFVFPFLYNFIYFLDNVHIVDKKNKNDNSKKFALRVFLITFIIWLIIGLAYYPGNATIDSVSQIMQASGQTTITNAHPAFNTIVMKWLLSIWSNIFIIVIANILFFSFVVTRIYKYMYEKKVNEKFLYISLLIFTLFVNNVSLITMIWKDVPFSIAMLWLTFELYKIVNEKDEYFKSNINVIFLILSLIITYFFRHNGIFPYYVAVLYLIYLIFKSKEKVRIIFTVILSVLLVFLIKGTLYDFYDVDDGSGYTTAGSGSFAAKGLGALVYYDADLSEEDRELISKIADFDELKLHYNAYSIDTYSQIPGWNAGIEKIGVAKIYELYIRNFFKNPKVIIRDKLDGSNLLWSYQTPKDGYNYKFDYGVDDTQFVDILNEFKPNYVNKYIPKRNLISEMINIYQVQTEKIELFDIIIWRFGVVLSVLLLLLYYVIIKKIRILPVTFPTLISILFWLVLMNHHSYRYLWFMFLNTFFIFMFVLIEKDKNCIDKKGKRK